MKKLIWILVNCNTVKEADSIGKALLKKRLIACYDIFPRQKAAYFWPPKSKKIETARGALLIGETLPNKISSSRKIIKKLHSDKRPFIGSLKIENISEAYFKWLRGELK